MNEEMILEMKRYIISRLAGREAQAYYDEFIRKFDKPSNREIENTKVIQVLRRMLFEIPDRFIFIREPNSIFYRSRLIQMDAESIVNSGISVEGIGGDTQFTGFDCYDSKEPPVGIPGSGRNNLKGVSYLYVADDSYTACAETRPKPGHLISVARFQNIKPLKIFNFSDDVEIPDINAESLEDVTTVRLITNILFQFTIPVVSNKEKEYYPSQYISDFIRKNGYDGICYMSAFSSGRCYTLFNCGESYIEFLDSEMVLHRVPEYHIYRLNSEEKIVPPKGFYDDANPSFGDFKDMKRKIAGIIQKANRVEGSTLEKDKSLYCNTPNQGSESDGQTPHGNPGPDSPEH